MPGESIRILVSAVSPDRLQRLRRLCQRAGFSHVTPIPVEELPSYPKNLYDLALVSLAAEDFPSISQQLSHCPTSALILLCHPEVAERYTDELSRLAPLEILVEPLTARQLRALLPVLFHRTQRLHTSTTAESNWLWDILSSIGDAIIVTDTAGHIQFLNPMAEKLTGWTLSEALHRPLEEVFPIYNEETGQPAENPVRRVLQEGIVVGLANHTILRRRDGEEIAIDDSGAPVRDRSGRILGAVLAFRDVTELRSLQRRNQRALELQQRLLHLLYSLLELRPPEQFLSDAVHALTELTPLDLACLYEVENEHLIPRWYSISTPSLESLVRSAIPLQRSLLGHILQQGKPEVVNNAHQDPRTYYPEDFIPPTSEHLIGIPMTVQQQRAILAIARFGQPPFSEEEADTVLLFARFIQLGLLNNGLWASLQRSETQYRELLEWLPVPVIIHREGRVLYANQSAAQYLGAQSPEELHGLSPLELVAAEDRPGAIERITALYRSEVSTVPPRHTVLLRRDGSRLESLVVATRATYEGSPAVLVIGIDITEQQRLQRQRDRERAAFQIIATASLQSHSIAELCQYFLTQAARELGFAGGNVRLLEGELLVPVALTGPFPPEQFPPVPITDERFLAAHVARTREPFFIPNADLYPLSEPHRQRLQEVGIRALVSYPILGESGTLLGTFQLFHPVPLELREEDRDFFTTLGAALGIAIERLRLQEKLRESEYRLRMLAEHAPIAITRFSLRERRYLFANREFERQSGYTLEEFEALSDRELIEMIHPEDRQTIFHFWRQWESAGFPGVQRLDYRIFNRQGEVVWLDTYLYAERNPDGSVESIVQVCVDITPLKRTEEALRQALQEDFRRTVQNLHAIVFRLQRGPDGRVRYALREGKLAGTMTTSALSDHPLEELPEELRISPDALERAFAGERVSYELPQGDRWLLYTLEPVPTEDGTITEVVGTGVDISQRKLLELSLDESEARYRLLLDALPVGILEVLFTEQGSQHDLYVNPAFTAITGYTFEDLRLISGANTVHPEDRDWVTQRWQEWIKDPTRQMLHLEYRCLRKDGQPYWLELHATKVRERSGWRVIEVGLDVTERKRAEEQLRYLAAFPEHSPIPIVELTAEGRLAYANPAARNSLPIAEFSPHHPWVAPVLDILPELVQSGVQTQVRELVLGDQAWLQHIFWLPGYNRVRIFAPEITTQLFLRRQLQEALEREQELAVMRSRMLSTIAHEFRTPLAGIQLSVELLQKYFDRLSPGERLQELANISSRVQDLNTLVTDFLAHSSLEGLRRSLRLAPVSLQSLCQEAAERVQPLLRSKSQALQLELPQNPVVIYGDARVLRFVLLNVLTNASKYSREHQSITVRLREELGTAVLEVEDSGIGIPEEDLSHVFQPFFRGSNTQGIPGVGLGLAMVKEFVEAHRGSVQLRSQVGVGTTVTLLFPLAEHGQTNAPLPYGEDPGH